MVFDMFTSFGVGAATIGLSVGIGYLLHKFVFNHGVKVGMWRIITFLVCSLIVGEIIKAIRG